MAKVTLKNGITVEADEVIINDDGTVTMRDIKTEDTRKAKPVLVTSNDEPEAVKNSELEKIINSLSKNQWETYAALKEMGGTVGITALAKALGCTNNAMSGRLGWLVQQGAVERVANGKYRALIP